MLFLIGQLPAGGINILTPASSQAHIHPVIHEVIGELHCLVLIGFHERGIIDGVVLDHIDQVRGDAAVDLDQVVGIFNRIVDVFEEDVFEGDVVLGLLVEIIQRFDQYINIVALVDRHDGIPLFIAGRMQGKCQVETDLVITQLANLLGNARCEKSSDAFALKSERTRCIVQLESFSSSIGDASRNGKCVIELEPKARKFRKLFAFRPPSRNNPSLGDRIAKEVRRFRMENLDWGNQREWTER